MMVGSRTVASLIALGLLCAMPARVHVQQPQRRPQPGTRLTDDQVRAWVAPMRAGRKLTPKSWPNGGKVAVCLSWDMDNESFDIAAGVSAPVVLSQGQYGATEGTPRILALYDKYNIPGSFYIPAVNAILYPEMINEIKKRPRHEIGVHGWIHESLPDLDDQAEEERLLKKSIDLWTKTLGHKPAGYRAPAWAFSKYTLDLIRKAGFEYDSSAMGMDEPYQIVANGTPIDMVELPVDWILDDYPYFISSGALPSPELIFKVYQDEFDKAYQEGTMFMLTMHPMVSGHRSRIIYLDKLIAYMKSKPGVWFATGQQIADYVKKSASPSQPKPTSKP
jgi:peptidoglycan/xylan/chitin deacetylase (PgdA/CDA1 family)